MTSSAPTVWVHARASLLLAGQALRWWTARQVLVKVVAGLAMAVMAGGVLAWFAVGCPVRPAALVAAR